MRISIVYFLFLLLFCFSSCLFDGHDDEQDKLSRTVLVFLGRDNDLNGSIEDKRSAIIEGWEGKQGNLVIYQDLKAEGASLEVISKEKGETKTTILYEHVSENSADPEVLSRVINEAVLECPADYYGLILFSHGTGWLPDASFSSPRSVVIDDFDVSTWMNLPDFANALPDSLFDYIVLEACFMGGIEVAYELKDKARYVLASPAEILSPGFREVYRTSVNQLFLPEADLASFAEDAFDMLSQDYWESATLTLYNTAGLEAITGWVRESVGSHEAFPPIDSIQVFDRKSYHLFFDFGQYYSAQATDEIAASRLAELLDECVVCKYATAAFLPKYGGFQIEHYSGFTTYIEQEKYPYLNAEYQKTKWVQAIAK